MTYQGPLVSVILPTYNGRHEWLSESIESVLYQTYKNFELLIINDASTNTIEETILQYQKKDQRILYIKNKENLKLTKTLNKWLELAKWKYIARIDDDDIWCDSDKLQKQVDFMEDNLGYWLCGTKTSFYLWENNKRIIATQYYSDYEIKDHFLKWNPIAHSSVIIRKSLLDRNWYYNPIYDGYEDYELRLRLWKYCKICNLKDLWMLYRQRDWSIITRRPIYRSWLFFKITFSYRKIYWWISIYSNLKRLFLSFLISVPILVAFVRFVKKAYNIFFK